MPTTVTQLVVDASGAEQGVQRYTTAMQSGASASDRLLSAQAKLQAMIDAQASAYDANTRAAAAMQQATDRIAEAQSRASSASAASVRAANDNTAALSRTAEAYKTAGQFALQHPVLVLAGSVAAARALSGFATSAAASLGSASASTAAFAEGASGMGATVVAGAALAARGLAGLSTGATAAAGGLSAYAEKVAGFTTATSLLSRGLSLIPPLFLPIAAAFVAFEVGSAVFSKAYNDLDRLIQLGEKARDLDVGAPFLKSFEALGPKIQATADQMDKALQQASNFVKERYGQTNGALSAVSSLYTAGAFGAEKPAAMDALEIATTTQEKVRATLDLIKELYDRGQGFAALDLTSKLFGPDVADRLRTGQASIDQIVADLTSLQDKEVLKQEQVDRALALNKQIADTKQAISDAWAVTVDFSGAALLLNEAWLKILQAVQWVVEAINSAIGAVGSFASAVASGIGGAFDAVSNKVSGLLTQMGVLSKQQQTAATELPKIDSSYGPQQPTITARQFPYTFGPTAPTGFQKPAAAAKQAKEAADTAISSYDNLIKRTQDHIDEMNLEAESVGKDAGAVIKLKLAHDLARAAQKDGTEVTAEMRAEWDRLGDTLATSTENLQKAKRSFEGIKEGQRELASDFTQFIEDITVGGQKLDQALQSLAKTLSSSALKAIISGEGPLAGILGTASDERGKLGGLLGGKLSFGSLFGGGSDAAGSPLPGAQGPSLPSNSLFGGLFDGDKITSALGLGAETGIGKALSDALKPSKPGGGIFSSPLGQGLASVGAGAAIGYSTQSPLMGALGGGLAGLASGNPILAIAGAGAGLLGGLFGESQAKKQAKKQLQQEIQARKEALEQARPQIEQLALTFEGGSIGNVGKTISDALSQAKQAIKTASDGGDQALADKLMADYQSYVARMTAIFSDSFNGMAAEVRAGFGISGPFSEAVSSVQQLGEALKGFLADSGRLSPDAVATARSAAVQGALSSLNPTPQLSETQTEIQRINGTAAGLVQVLKDLGLSADQAAAAIKDGTNKALDALASKFNTDLDRKINAAKGKDYLNDAADLIKEVAGLSQDAASLGQDGSKVSDYFSAAAQKIVDGSQLVGDSFNELVAAFPQLAGVVHEFSADSGKSVQDMAKEAAEALAAIQDRKRDYEDRYVAATFTGSDLNTQLMLFERKAEWDRWTEMAKGGQAMEGLLQAQEAERAQLIAQYMAAIQERRQGYQDRLFAATTDTTTLNGQLAAFDRQAAQDRAAEYKAGGEAINDLIAAQNAERLKIIKDFTKQAQSAFDDFANTIKKFLDSLVAGSNSPLSPEDRLKAAQQQYNDQLALARGGDKDAIGSITTYAQSLLDAGKAFYASSQAFQDIFKNVQDTLGALPGQIGLNGFMQQYATGGWVRGPGTGTSDSMVARVSNGEFVMSAGPAGRYGPILEAMNDDRPMGAFASPRVSGGDGQNTAALINELRALRSEVEALRGDVQEGNDIAENGHLATIAATKDVGAGISKTNRDRSRREVAA